MTLAAILQIGLWLICGSTLVCSVSSPSGDHAIPYAFVQTGSELFYYDNIAESDLPFDQFTQCAEQIEVSPKIVSFAKSEIGIVASKSVVITNIGDDVDIKAIYSPSLNFYSEFDKDQMLIKNTPTHLPIHFLPTVIGKVESEVKILTGRGWLTLGVEGWGAASSYGIWTAPAIKVALNQTVAWPIRVYNPHQSILRVVQVASSSLSIRLEVPGEDVNAFEIVPFSTKVICYAHIVGSYDYDTTAFVSIKTEIQEAVQPVDALKAFRMGPPIPDFIITPFTINVVDRQQLFAVVPLLDFGNIVEGESRSLFMEVYSTIDQNIDIESIYVEQSPYANFVKLTFSKTPPVSIPGGIKGMPGEAVTLTEVTIKPDFQHLVSRKPSFLRGRIIAESRGGNYNVTVDFQAKLITENLLVAPDADIAFHRYRAPTNRTLELVNKLPEEVVVIDVKVPDEYAESFKADLVSSSIRLGPYERKPALFVSYVSPWFGKTSVFLTVITPTHGFPIELKVFYRRLRVVIHAAQNDRFDFGAIEVNKERSITFSVVNLDPVPVVLRSLAPLDHIHSSLQFLGEQPNTNGTAGDNSRSFRRSQPWQAGRDFVLHEMSTALFKYSIVARANQVEGQPFVINTDFEELTFPVTYSLTETSIIANEDVMDFGRVFPGMLVSRSIDLATSDASELPVERVALYNPDNRLFFRKLNHSVTLTGKPTTVAEIMLKPDALGPESRYVGIPLHTSEGQWFTYGMKLPSNLADIDNYLYRRIRSRFDSLVAANLNYINKSVFIDTPLIKNFEVPLKAELTWPQLMSHSVVHFPLTAVGNFSIVNLTLSNPTSMPIVVQLLPLVIYPDADSFLHFFRGDLPSPLLDPIEINETLMFSLRDTELFTLKPSSPIPKMREEVEAVVESPVPRFTLSLLLQPLMNVRIRIGFLPSDYELHSSLLLVRNNLTVVEPVVLYGRGARIDMKVENKATRSEPSLFDIQPFHLKDCFNPKRQMHKLSTTLTVKRPFEVTNTGDVPFVVTNMSINNVACEHRGFHILNCHPFSLSPGESYFLEIAYTPDFLMSVNEASLQMYMHMNGTPWVYYIGATVPEHMLPMCHSALPRPPFEGFMYYSCIVALIFCLICVMACSYLEGDRLITYTLRKASQHAYRLLQPALPTKVNNNVTTQTKRRRPSHFRNHVEVAKDSHFIIRWFCYAANLFLWLFSFVFIAFRSYPVTVTARKRRPKKPKGIPGIEVHEEAPERHLSASKLDTRPGMPLPGFPFVTKPPPPPPPPAPTPSQPAPSDVKQLKGKRKKSPKHKRMIVKPMPAVSPKPAEKPVVEEMADVKKESKDPAEPKDVPAPENPNERQESEPVGDQKPEEEQQAQSDDSAPPEWADEQVEGEDYDKNFDDIVHATAVLFEAPNDSPISTPDRALLPEAGSFSTEDSESSEQSFSAAARKRMRRKNNKAAAAAAASRMPPVSDTRERVIDLLTKKFRDDLTHMLDSFPNIDESFMQSPAGQSRIYQYILNQQMFSAMYGPEWQGAYHNLVNTYQQYQYFQQFAAMPYDGRDTAASPPGFSSDSSSHPSENINSFNNSRSNNPIGAIGEQRPRVAPSPPIMHNVTASPVNIPTHSDIANVVGGFPRRPSQPPARQSYSLFANNPVWKPLLEDASPSTVAPEWPSLFKKSDDRK